MTNSPALLSKIAQQEASSSSRPLMAQRRFFPMWSAFSLGAFTDNMLRQSLIVGIPFGAIAMPAFFAGDNAVPVIGSLFALAMLCFSPLAGQFADKFETLFMFKRTKFVEAVIMITAALGFLINNGGLLVLAMFAMGAQSAFFSPVRIGAMPKYFLPGELIRANALCNAGLFVSIILGLFFGGLFVEQPSGKIIIAVILVIASITGWFIVRRAPEAAPNAPSLKIDYNIFAQGYQIIGYAIKAPGVIRPMIGFGVFYYVSTFITVLLPIYVRDELGGSGVVATAIMGFFAIGTGLGALGAAMLAKNKSGLGYSTLGITGSAIATFVAFSLTGPAAAGGAATVEFLFKNPAGIALILSFATSSALMGLYIAPLQAAVQRRAPAEVRARIMAAGNMINAFTAFAGSMSVLIVTSTSFSAANALLVVATIQVAIALYMIRRHQTMPPNLHDEMLIAPNTSGDADVI